MDTSDIWPTGEAKARFSELLRMVREGRTITVTYHGKAVAEVRPIAPNPGVEQRIERLRARGVLSLSEARSDSLRPLERKEGALARFLDERHR